MNTAATGGVLLSGSQSQAPNIIHEPGIIYNSGGGASGSRAQANGGIRKLVPSQNALSPGNGLVNAYNGQNIHFPSNNQTTTNSGSFTH